MHLHGGTDGQARQPRQSGQGTKEAEEDETGASTTGKAALGMDSCEALKPEHPVTELVGGSLAQIGPDNLLAEM